MQKFVVSSKLTLLLFDSIKELPASQYQSARQYEILSAELGSSEAEQAQMLDRAESYALAGKLPEFQEQMKNYRLARYLTKNNFQPGQLDWACHVSSANGVRIKDYSEDNLLLLIEEWSRLGLTQALIEQLLADVKKNSMTS